MLGKINWKEVDARLPTLLTPEDKAKRLKLFSQMDVNGNRIVSLAEVDKAFRDVFAMVQIYDSKPVLLKAFNAAKGIDVHSKSNFADDYVSWSEFRVLLVKIKEYFEVWAAFDRVDTSDDKRITPEEFSKAIGSIERWVGKIGDPAAEFKKIDKNGGGFILFDEFLTWALEKNLDVEVDDGYEDKI